MEPMARLAIDRNYTPHPIVEELTLTDELINRYVWYGGENLPWPEIEGGFIKRCRVTPIVPFPIWERINDVPTDLRKAVRRDPMDRDHQEAKYYIPAQGILESVMIQYEALGLRELTVLGGMEPQEVAALNIDATFCPWHSDEIPKPYREIEDQINRALLALNDNKLLRLVGKEMLESIKVSRQYDEMFVDRTENAKEPVYSNPVFRAMSRLERRRRDHAINDMAAADLAAKKAQAGGDNAALVAEMAEQNRLKREELELRREELELNRQAMAKRAPGRPPKQSQADA